jgi:hypothetical protein
MSLETNNFEFGEFLLDIDEKVKQIDLSLLICLDTPPAAAC